MNKSVDPELKQKMQALCGEMLEKLASNASNYRELVAMWQELHASYLDTTANCLQQWAEKYETAGAETAVVDKLEADEVVVEFLAKNTGKIFRRNLPITYLETDNGLILSGETIEGNPAKIAFFSEAALAKIHDLVGKGPDVSQCDD